MKLLEENIGKTFSDINRTNVFLDQSPKASSHQVANVLEFQLQHHSFQRTPRADLL